jgi:hypothetical protein
LWRKSGYTHFKHRYFTPIKLFVLAKKSFVLRIDEQAYKALEKWAADEFRSVNGQIEMLLDKALKEANRVKATTANNATKK